MSDLEATIRIGKNGITQGVIEEIKNQLERRKIVKIKFLKNADREDFKEKAEYLARASGGVLEEVRGFTVILRKK